MYCEKSNGPVFFSLLFSMPFLVRLFLSHFFITYSEGLRLPQKQKNPCFFVCFFSLPFPFILERIYHFLPTSHQPLCALIFFSLPKTPSTAIKGMKRKEKKNDEFHTPSSIYKTSQMRHRLYTIPSLTNSLLSGTIVSSRVP